MAYVRNSSEPIRINHQNICGTTTCFFFSVAYHWTKNREEKVALASQPTAVQKVSQGTPKILPSCQMRSRNECICKLSRSRAALKSTKFQHPSSREIPSFKLQSHSGGELFVGAWNFSGAWTLGAWCFFISPA